MDEGSRTQPEFSLGERLASLEADRDAFAESFGRSERSWQEQIDRRFAEQEALFDQKLWGLGERLEAINSAQQEAVEKADQAVQRTLQAITEGIERSRKETSDASDRYRREVATRIEALERGEAGEQGIRQYKGSQVAWIGAAAALASALIYTVLLLHP